VDIFLIYAQTKDAASCGVFLLFQFSR